MVGGRSQCHRFSSFTTRLQQHAKHTLIISKQLHAKLQSFHVRKTQNCKPVNSEIHPSAKHHVLLFGQIIECNDAHQTDQSNQKCIQILEAMKLKSGLNCVCQI